MLSLSKKARRLAIAAAGVSALIATAAFAGPAVAGTDLWHAAKDKPTVVLVHGAWADGSSWDKVASRLQDDGYPVVTPPDELRGVAWDAGNLRAYLNTVTGPIVLVGHSYGGMVITNAALGDKQVKALVYVDAYIPDQDDSVMSLTGALPGSVFAADPSTLFNQVVIPNGPDNAADLYVKPSVFGPAFTGKSVPAPEVALLASRQRPLSSAALMEKSKEPAWQTIPSWSIIGKQDAIIPPAEQVVMAKRAKAHTVEINAPHLSMVTAPGAITGQIENAAKATD